MHSQSLIDTVHALEAEQAQNDREMTTLHNQAQGTTIPEDRLRELLKVAANDIPALLSVVVRVEVGKDRIRVWTLLDAKPDGTFDFNTDWDDPETGLIIIPGVAPPVPNKQRPHSGMLLISCLWDSNPTVSEGEQTLFRWALLLLYHILKSNRPPAKQAAPPLGDAACLLRFAVRLNMA